MTRSTDETMKHAEFEMAYAAGDGLGVYGAYYALARKCETLSERVEELEGELVNFVSEAVRQECRDPHSGRDDLYTHSYVSNREQWIALLVEKGVMRYVERERYEFVPRE